MADWIVEVDRLDKLLHSEGVPDGVRGRFIAQYADILAQADKARRDATAALWADRAAALALPNGASSAASELGCHRATVYRRAKRHAQSRMAAIGSRDT